MDLVLASNNNKKIEELSRLLAPIGWTLRPQAQLGIPECPEPHPSFVENALAKARHAARLSGLPALADDSGLCVSALGGAPGVHSARFAGDPRSDQRNNEKLLAELATANTRQDAQQSDKTRQAYYYCVLVFLRNADDPQPIIAEGEWHGEILSAAQGNGGFGYDPLFLVRALGKSVAELSASEKNRYSHRSQALSRLLERLKNAALEAMPRSQQTSQQ
ncbi:MAG: RdgB/HAM1 family non-canonical purine NTP pyrophosphatase [Pseudomonadota bacterium]